MSRKRKKVDQANYIYDIEAGKILGVSRVTFYMCTIKTYPPMKGGRIVQSGKKSKKRSAKFFQIDQFIKFYNTDVDIGVTELTLR